MKHLLLILALALTIQGEKIVISNYGKPVASVRLPGGALVITDYMLVIGNTLEILPVREEIAPDCQYGVRTVKE